MYKVQKEKNVMNMQYIIQRPINNTQTNCKFTNNKKIVFETGRYKQFKHLNI